MSEWIDEELELPNEVGSTVFGLALSTILLQKEQEALECDCECHFNDVLHITECCNKTYVRFDRN